MKKLLVLLLLFISISCFAELYYFTNGDSLGDVRGKLNHDILELSETGYVYLTAPAITTCTLADSSYKIQGTFTDYGWNINYTTAADGTITYNGSGATITTISTWYIKTDKACNLTFTPRVNGVPLPAPVGYINVPAAAKSQPLAYCSKGVVANGDYLEMYVSSDVADTEITIQLLNLVVE